jgi:hypothetical protein
MSTSLDPTLSPLPLHSLYETYLLHPSSLSTTLNSKFHPISPTTKTSTLLTMRLLIPLLLLVTFLTLVSAKGWCWLGKCPGHHDDKFNPSKRFSVRRQEDGPVFNDNPDVVHNDETPYRRQEDGPVFEDGPDVVHNDNAFADSQECHADCALIHELCTAEGEMSGQKCLEMQCGVFGNKVCVQT